MLFGECIKSLIALSIDPKIQQALSLLLSGVNQSQCVAFALQVDRCGHCKRLAKAAIILASAAYASVLPGHRHSLL